MKRERFLFMIWLGVCLFLMFVISVFGVGIVPTKPYYQIFPGDTLADARSYPASYSLKHYGNYPGKTVVRDLRPSCKLNQECLSRYCDRKARVCVGKKQRNQFCRRNYECVSYVCDRTRWRCT